MKTTVIHQVSEASPSSLRWRKVTTALTERAWLILLFLVVGGGLAAFYLYRAPRLFTAKTVLEYDTRATLFPDRNGAGSESSAGSIDRRLTEIRRKLVSAEFLRRVVQNTSLASHPDFAVKDKAGEAAIELAATRLRNAVLVEIPPGDVVVSVTVSAREAALAAKLANAMADEMLAEVDRGRDEGRRAETVKLESALQQLRTEIGKIQQEEKPNTGKDQESARKQQEALRAAEELTRNLTAVDSRRDELRSGLDRLRRRQNDAEAMAQDPSVATNAAVAAARQEVDLCRSAFAAITNRYLDKHPKYLEAKARCDDSLGRLTQAVTNAVRQLEIAAQQAEADRQAIERQIQSRNADAQALGEEVKGSTNEFVVRTSRLLMDFHDRVLQRLKEDSLTGTLQGQPLKVFSAATTPTQAVGPNATRVIATGLIAGLVVGLLLSLVFGLGDTSLKSVDEAEVLLRLPVLSVVPVLRNDETEMAAAEGFRSLRTSISVLAKGSEPRSLLFTSTSPDEGKTFCALNFAVGLAQQGAKTVLVECDLRRPMAAPSLTRVKMDHPGVSEFLKRAQQKAVARRDVRREPQPADLSFSELRRKQREAAGEAGAAPADGSMAVVPTAGGMGLDEVLQPTEIENLSFVAAGAPVSNPSEMLGQGGFDHLMSELLKRFERVVIDSAPMLGISDTLLLSKRVQAICFVVRANQTPRRAVVRAVEILKRAEAPLAGVILNGLTPNRSDPYGQNYYYYYRADQKGKK